MDAFRIRFLAWFLVLAAAGSCKDASCNTGAAPLGASLLQVGQNQMASLDANLTSGSISEREGSLETQRTSAKAVVAVALSEEASVTGSGNDKRDGKTQGGKHGTEHSVLQAQTLASCGVTLCLVAIASQEWLWSGLFDARPAMHSDTKTSGAGRDLLVDNVRVWGVALIIWGHFIYYNLGWEGETTVYYDRRTWLKGFEGLGEHLLAFTSVLSLPTVCFISGYVSKGAPTEERIRRYFQFLVIPTLIWIFFCKPVVMELMMDPSVRLLQAKMDAITQLNLFHVEWYLQALCMWRASVFLLWCHLRTPVSLTLMLALSCAGGYVHFEGALGDLMLEPALGFLPYFAAGYAFPQGQLHAFASWRSPKIIATALFFVVAWIELVIPSLADGDLPDGHGSYDCCNTQNREMFASISAHSADHALYWTRRLSKFGLEMVPTIIMIMVVTPHGEMMGLSWIGPHTIYPFVFHEVANHWHDSLVQAMRPPVVTSMSGHMIILLLHVAWAVAVLALFSSPPFRWAFAWCFQPTWVEPCFKALANPVKNGFVHRSSQQVQGDSLQCDEKPSQSSSPPSDFLPGAAHSAKKAHDPASYGKPLPNMRKAVPWMQEARPFYPLLMPLFICLVLGPLATVKFTQYVLGIDGMAAGIIRLANLTLPLAWLSCAGYILVAVVNSLMEAKRLSDALEPSSTHFAGQLKHIVVIPNYKEPLTVLRRTIASIAQASHTHLGGQLTVVLACEARDVGAEDSYNALKSEFAEVFEEIMFTQHVLLPGELVGKSSNENFAVREVYKRYVDCLDMDPFSIMLTICDADSIFHPNYFADVEATFWSHRDGRRFIYTGPLNTYRNLSSGPIVTQFYEILRSHADTFLAVTEPVQPQSNYSLTLGFCEEIDFWTPDNTPEDVHTCRKAQFNNLGLRSTLKIGSVIVNDLVEDLSDRYVQAKRHRWGITEIAWVFSLYHHMQLRSWLYLLFIELAAGTFTEEAALLSKNILNVWIATSFWYEVDIKENLGCLLPFFVMFIFHWARFWLEELFLWQKVLCHYPIERPSFLNWVVLVVLSPVLWCLANLFFHIVPTIDCLIHVTFFGELFYVNAPKGTAEERLAIQQKQEGAAAMDSPSEVTASPLETFAKQPAAACGDLCNAIGGKAALTDDPSK